MAKKKKRRKVNRAKGPALFLGIDPGQKGYFCVYDDDEVIRAMIPIPLDAKDKVDMKAVVRLIRALRKKGVCFALVERQQVFSKQGAVSAWTNASGYVAILTALECIMPGDYEIVGSGEWKKEIGLPVPVVELNVPEGASKAKIEKAKRKVAAEKKKLRKQYAIDMAKDEYPGFDWREKETPRHTKDSDGKCESFLIATLARRRHHLRRGAA